MRDDRVNCDSQTTHHHNNLTLAFCNFLMYPQITSITLNIPNLLHKKTTPQRSGFFFFNNQKLTRSETYIAGVLRIQFILTSNCDLKTGGVSFRNKISEAVHSLERR